MSDERRLEETLAALAAAQDLDAVDAIRVEALGKQGWISLALKTLGKMSPDERAEAAPRIQSMRARLADAIAEHKTALENAELERRLASETLDLSLPGK